jgi:hypothetical protein
MKPATIDAMPRSAISAIRPRSGNLLERLVFNNRLQS